MRTSLSSIVSLFRLMYKHIPLTCLLLESTILSLACSPQFWAWKSSPSATVSLAQRIIISLKRIRTYGPTQRCWLPISKMDSLRVRRKKCVLGEELTEGIMFRCKNFLINAVPTPKSFASLLLVCYVSCTAISSLLHLCLPFEIHLHHTLSYIHYSRCGDGYARNQRTDGLRLGCTSDGWIYGLMFKLAMCSTHYFSIYLVITLYRSSNQVCLL